MARNKSIKSNARLVVKAWNEFLRDPSNKLPVVADAIQHLDALLRQMDEEENDKSQLKLFK